MADWRPSASFENLERRAALLAELRDFFARREVLEVETPLLASAPVSDPNIEAVSALHPTGGDLPCWLQTSPEFAMKRLLAAGSGPIYQICKAFRRGERGARHNPEFSMLEWYRPGMRLESLIEEVVEVIEIAVGESRDVLHFSYRQAFLQYLNIDPFTAELDELRALAHARLELAFDGDDRDMWLQLLMSTQVEPCFPAQSITVVQDFPASQAALAELAEDDDGNAVARRFEAFYGAMELANGYQELRDTSELLRRIRHDHVVRQRAGQDLPPVDRHLLKAMHSGLPECSGVAMGLDRLVMLACESSRIDDVIAFPFERA